MNTFMCYLIPKTIYHYWKIHPWLWNVSIVSELKFFVLKVFWRLFLPHDSSHFPIMCLSLMVSNFFSARALLDKFQVFYLYALKIYGNFIYITRPYLKLSLFLGALVIDEILTELSEQGKAKNKLWYDNRIRLRPPLSGWLDKFSLFTRLVCQANALNLFCMRKKPCLIRDLNPGSLGFKSAMLPTEPLRLAMRSPLTQADKATRWNLWMT
jgi:hypothetical protein